MNDGGTCGAHEGDESETARVVAELVANHREFLAFVERRVGDRALAEDLIQEAFVRSIDRFGELRTTDSIRAWFFRTLRNAVVDHHRRNSASDRRLEALAATLDPDGAAEPELERVVCACVARLAKSLKPEYSQALSRVEIDGASVGDFAREAGITENNAGVRLHRARAALRREVSRSCGTCAEHGCLDCTCSNE
jgi:RNA polymerase sigma factor (sigma-70 family)